MRILDELFILADKLLEFYNDMNDLSNDWNLNHEEIRDEIKVLSGDLIDQIEKIKRVHY